MAEAWWWLSFADPDRPRGEQFLGGCIVRAADMKGAVEEAWRLGINPGGEVAGFEVPPEYEANIARFGTNRLLSKAELNDQGEFNKGDRAKHH